MFRFFKKQRQDDLPDIEKVGRGERASHLLQSHIFNDVLDDLEEDFWNSHFHTSVEDYEARENLYNYIQVLQMVKSKLETWKGEAEWARQILKDKGEL